MTIDDLQLLIDRMYSAKDRQRGTAATFLWFCEEIGELATALREGTQQDKAAEFADSRIIFWNHDDRLAAVGRKRRAAWQARDRR